MKLSLTSKKESIAFTIFIINAKWKILICEFQVICLIITFIKKIFNNNFFIRKLEKKNILIN